MTPSFPRRAVTALAFVFLCLAGCNKAGAPGEGATRSYGEHEDMRRRAEQLVQRFTELERRSRVERDVGTEHDRVMMDVLVRIGQLNLGLEGLRLRANLIRLGIEMHRVTNDRAVLLGHVTTFETDVAQTLGRIAAVETELRNAIARLHASLPVFYDAESRQLRNAYINKHLEPAVRSLQGLRALIVELDRFVRADVNARLTAAGQLRIPAATTTPVVPAPALPQQQQPQRQAPPTGSVAGTVLAPNGTDAVAAALVFAPVEGNEAIADGIARIQPGQGTALPCGEPTVAYLAKTCTSPTGRFTLENVPVGNLALRVVRGLFRLNAQAQVRANQTTSLPAAETTLPNQNGPRGNIARIAVIPGAHDHMENVLAKLGLATMRDNGTIVPGSERFEIMPAERALTVFRDRALVNAYQIIVVNCGAELRDILASAQAKAGLRRFVDEGGRLYVTDLANDLVEQVFPEYIRFRGDANETAPGAIGAAHQGTSGITVRASLRNLTLERWLRDGVRCGSLTRAADQTGCLNADGSATIEGFLSGWAIMEGVHPGRAAQTATWVEGNAMAAVRPLSVMFRHGNGKVLYTSYHTVHNQAAGSISPQERILQYFVFEVGQ